MINNKLNCYDLKKRFAALNLIAILSVLVLLLFMLKGQTLILNISKSVRVTFLEFRVDMDW